MHASTTLPLGAVESRLSGLLQRYRDIRAATLKLCEGLSAEDCALQSMPDTSPAKWHIAHASWFFETFVLEPHAPGYRAFDPHFRALYNSYYVQVGERHPRPERGLISRPSLEQVRAYRAHVDAAIERWAAAWRADTALLDLFELGLHHEQQHQELILTDIKHALAASPLRPRYAPASADARAPSPSAQVAPLRWVPYSTTIADVGAAPGGFAFDNELPRHKALVHGFELADRPVTCGELMAFIDDGGYDRPELWQSEGWVTSQREGWRAPLYWERRDGAWWQMTLAGLRPVTPAEPACHLSWFEAEAYASWAGARLPTEHEWEVAAAAVPLEGNFVESGALHPLPTAANDESAVHPRQLFGDVWEWTASAYLPYPGFQPWPGPLGEYNAKFMSGQMVLRGGSCATPRSHIRSSYRNYFPPQARWQFSGVRLAR